MKDLLNYCAIITQFEFTYLNHQTSKRVDKRMLVTSYFSHSFTPVNSVTVMYTGEMTVCGFSDDMNGRTVKHMWGIGKEARCRMN